MFEEIRQLSTQPKSIVLQTHRGANIPNSIAPPVGTRELEVYQKFRAQFGTQWEQRKNASGIYNCFGHVFACRRTSIYDDTNSDITTILEHDGYRKLPPLELPKPEDVVLYRNKSRTESLLHAGRVLKVVEVFTPVYDLVSGQFRTHDIQVLSKWNDSSGEDIHSLSDVPYHRQRIDMIVELWTDRV